MVSETPIQEDREQVPHRKRATLFEVLRKKVASELSFTVAISGEFVTFEVGFHLGWPYFIEFCLGCFRFCSLCIHYKLISDACRRGKPLLELSVAIYYHPWRSLYLV